MTSNKPTFYCYLDGFDRITIIIPKDNYKKHNKYYLIGEEEVIDLEINRSQDLGHEMKIIAYFNAYINLGKIYHVEDDFGEIGELYTGKIVRSDLFDIVYRYRKNDLGVTYTNDMTTFKIWSPVAKYITLELVDASGHIMLYDMVYKNLGVWTKKIEKDIEGYKYRYRVYVNGKERIVMDPYAIASNANGEYGFIVDKSKFYQMKHTSNFSGNILDAVIYEMSVRDFTIQKDMPFKNKGNFLGLVEENIKTKAGLTAGLDYLKDLGVTHIQLMPIFDFDGVDENNRDKLYNWGYNPHQFFVPEGWYSTDPNDPYSRINDLREMIDKIHEAGLNVVMDVVFNHVYNAKQFPFERLVPGYAFHFDREGMLTEVSGCENDIASHRKMIKKLIVDNVLYWANEYKVDGFRFDLMGLIDFETMNELRQELDEISNHIIVYGEGWNMYSSNMSDRMAHMSNRNVIHTIGFFNDKFRNTIKGSTFDDESNGYATGYLKDTDILEQMLCGSAINQYMFKYTTQSINYVECHDNYTFFDKASIQSKDEVLLKKQAKLALSLTILSQGVPFIHSGQEFLRTKHMVENSYNSGDEINLIDWNRRDLYNDVVDYVKKLIDIRKSHHCFKLKNSHDLHTYMTVKTLESKSIMMHLTKDEDLIIIFKPTDTLEEMNISQDYTLYLASEAVTFEANKLILKDIGTYILKRGDIKC